LALGVSALALLGGCGKKDIIDPPAELAKIDATLKIEKEWSTGLGDDGERLRLGLAPVVADGVVYVASHKGVVLALNAATGKRLWITKTKLPLSGGPGVGPSAVVVGSSSGEVVALDTKSGKQLWRRFIGGEVLARPLVTEDVTVIRTINGRMQALTVLDGDPRWSAEETVPKLTLRGSSPPVLAGDMVVSGFDNGNVAAVDLKSGDTLWDNTINAPRGRSELERLADIDAPIRVVGRDVFVAGFQGRLAMLSLDSGDIWWARDASSYRGFDLDDANIYLTNSDSVVMSMRKTDGTSVWEQPALKRRSLTAPALDGEALVVGDFEGYLHWLDKNTGTIIGRAKTDGERITNAPVVADGRVYVLTDSGSLIAFKASPKGQKRKEKVAEPAPAEPEQPATSETPAPPAG
jgi:outer membrane protein assembly factor BamB